VASVIYLSFARISSVLVTFVTLVSLVVVLPTARNHSIQFLRSFSVLARIENYKSTLNIISKSPLIGVGYNNMCIAYNKFIGFQKLSSHACSGSDSSILFILATTGVMGLIIFTHLVLQIGDCIKNSKIYMSLHRLLHYIA
jgi:O-antigen ligase